MKGVHSKDREGNTLGLTAFGGAIRNNSPQASATLLRAIKG